MQQNANSLGYSGSYEEVGVSRGISSLKVVADRMKKNWNWWGNRASERLIEAPQWRRPSMPNLLSTFMKSWSRAGSPLACFDADCASMSFSPLESAADSTLVLESANTDHLCLHMQNIPTKNAPPTGTIKTSEASWNPILLTTTKLAAGAAPGQ